MTPTLRAAQAESADGGLVLTLIHAGHTAVLWLADVAVWIGANLPWMLAAASPLALTAVLVHRRLTARALAERTRYVLTPSPDFDPQDEHLVRYAMQIVRAANSGPWWAPRAGRSARIRFRADGSVPLEMSVEASTSARHLLRTSQYPGVTITEAPVLDDEERAHTVRAEFHLAGAETGQLRKVPMIPDPLQGIVDAVADISTDHCDMAELCLDVQRIPRWQLLLTRWRVMQDARERQRTWAKKEGRRAAQDAAEVEDSWQNQLARLLDPEQQAPRRLAAAPARVKPMETEKVLGRLAATDRQLLRVQLLARCVSEQEGRAEQTMARLSAALDVFGGGNTWVEDAQSLGKWRFTANTRGRRRHFDRRWNTGRLAARKPSRVAVGELHGLLKPVTVHCTLPVMASQLPTYQLGAPLVPQGIHHTPDGRSRIVSVPAAEFFFSLKVGRSRYGKTETAEAQALALALAGFGVGFVDPHGDSWNHVAPYLAHELLADRVCRVDLTGRSSLVPTWNPLGMERGQEAHEVVTAVVDSLSSAMNWENSSAPRGLTILVKAVEALVGFNRHAVRMQAPGAQATLFQIPALLEDEIFRTRILEYVPTAQRQWWLTTFTRIDPAAHAVIINPLTRLATNPVALAFLGSATSGFDARAAMDNSQLVWICPAGTGPTDSLLTALLINDLFRAGRSREDLPVDQRPEWHLFVDELISFDKATGGVIASFTEQLAKFGLRVHMMTQLLQRVSQSTRDSVLQNASALSSTAGSTQAVRLVAAEWHDRVDTSRIATLPKFWYYASMTAGGVQHGPMLLQGMQVDEVFAAMVRGGNAGSLPALERSAAAAVGSAHRDRLVREAGYRQDVVAYFAREKKLPVGQTLQSIINGGAVNLTKPGGLPPTPGTGGAPVQGVVTTPVVPAPAPTGVGPAVGAAPAGGGAGTAGTSGPGDGGGGLTVIADQGP
ncbi:ATP/GTP-binding protein [Kitasatospora purpeofusca]|uniref:ATP/GTP-binding protein n=1 Tax=Kitasatospora purpeofusca TaxID=67352 RepID=UPI0035E127C9